MLYLCVLLTHGLGGTDVEMMMLSDPRKSSTWLSEVHSPVWLVTPQQFGKLHKELKAAGSLSAGQLQWFGPGLASEKWRVFCTFSHIEFMNQQKICFAYFVHIIGFSCVFSAYLCKKKFGWCFLKLGRSFFTNSLCNICSHAWSSFIYLYQQYIKLKSIHPGAAITGA